MPPSRAMLLAIDAFKSPSRHRKLGSQPFPDGMLDVIKAAAGDGDTLVKAAESAGLSEESMREAARHYLLSSLLDPAAQGVRLLGLNPGATSEQIKNHKRWLMKWLHPDRNPSAWEQSLFLKVSAVADTLGADEPDARVRRPSRTARSRRRWAPVDRRIRIASSSAIAFRLAQPMILGLFAAGALLWLMWPGGNRLETAIAYIRGEPANAAQSETPKRAGMP